MKVFISQPMAGKSDEEIMFERRWAIDCLNRNDFGVEEKDVLDSFFRDKHANETPMELLGRSIRLMAQADLVVFVGNWGRARGCMIEYETAVRYGKKIMVIDSCRNTSSFVMDFGQALDHMKGGRRMTRIAWNDRAIGVVYQKGYPEGIPCNANTASAWGMDIGDLFKCEPYLQISTADGSHRMWAPCADDCLATDWTFADI